MPLLCSQLLLGTPNHLLSLYAPPSIRFESMGYLKLSISSPAWYIMKTSHRSTHHASSSLATGHLPEAQSSYHSDNNAKHTLINPAGQSLAISFLTTFFFAYCCDNLLRIFPFLFSHCHFGLLLLTSFLCLMNVTIHFSKKLPKSNFI